MDIKLSLSQQSAEERVKSQHVVGTLSQLLKEKKLRPIDNHAKFKDLVKEKKYEEKKKELEVKKKLPKAYKKGGVPKIEKTISTGA